MLPVNWEEKQEKGSIRIRKPDFRSLLRRTEKIRTRLSDFGNSLGFTQEATLLILGGITGILCGFGAVVFHESIAFFYEIFFTHSKSYINEQIFQGISVLSIIGIILLPAIGGLIVGILSFLFEKGEKSEGIPSVIVAVATRGGVIKPFVSVLKTIQAAVSIGSGGAGGKEGPIVQIGAAIGSSFGQVLNLSSERLRILVGCGAAAGLSAAFNTPLGGALFAMEIILRSFNAKSFSPIIIASVFGTVVSHYFLGDEPSFKIPKYQLLNNIEFLFYILLGILSAAVSIYFVKVFLLIDKGFDRLKKIPAYWKPAIGGLFVGIIGLWLPGVYGFTYKYIDSSLYNSAPFWMLLLLMIFKPIATGFTIGSGGNGGTFAPSLFTGAMLGGAFGQAINYFFPELGVSPGAYALVGMAAVVAGNTHASLTALIMVFELTNNYNIILPLMLTIIISATISRYVLNGSLYTLKFKSQGQDFDIYGRKVSVLKSIPIDSVKEPIECFVEISDSFSTILEKLKGSRFSTLPVMRNSTVIGVISFAHIREFLMNEEAKSLLYFVVAEDLMSKAFGVVFDDSDAESALLAIDSRDLEYICIKNRSDGEIHWMITREKLLKLYQNELFLSEELKDLKIS